MTQWLFLVAFVLVIAYTARGQVRKKREKEEIHRATLSRARRENRDA